MAGTQTEKREKLPPKEGARPLLGDFLNKDGGSMMSTEEVRRIIEKGTRDSDEHEDLSGQDSEEPRTSGVQPPQKEEIQPDPELQPRPPRKFYRERGDEFTLELLLQGAVRDTFEFCPGFEVTFQSIDTDESMEIAKDCFKSEMTMKEHADLVNLEKICRGIVRINGKPIIAAKVRHILGGLSHVLTNALLQEYFQFEADIETLLMGDDLKN